MKEAIVSQGPSVKLQDSPIPTPGPDDVVIKVVVSGLNPKDWKICYWMNLSINTGDDIAGIVHSVGSNVYEFAPGDRVASFHEMNSPGGSFAEYAVGRQHTTFKIPKKVSFEDASTIPLAAMTAAIGMHRKLRLPEPWNPVTTPTPFVVYGGATAVGAFAIQFAKKANIHPIIAVAGRGASFVEGLIDRSKGDTIVDYRGGDAAVSQGIKDALKGQKLLYAYDAVCEKNSAYNIGQAMAEGGEITLVLPPNDEKGIPMFGQGFPGVPEGIVQSHTMVGGAHGEDADFAFVMFRFMARGLEQGWFKAHPAQVMKDGLAGLQGALENLRDGKASATKYVFRIAETPGVSA